MRADCHMPLHGAVSVKAADPLTVEILEALDLLAKRIGVASEKNFSTYYFKSEATRYFLDLNLIRRHVPFGLMLDIGTFPSHLHQILLDLGYDVYGVDLDPSRIQEELNDAKKKTMAWNIESETWPKEKVGPYDGILCLDVLEHLHIDPLRFFLKVGQLLKDKGNFLISTPNLLSLSSRLKFLLGKQVLEHPLSVFEKFERQGVRGRAVRRDRGQVGTARFPGPRDRLLGQERTGWAIRRYERN